MLLATPMPALSGASATVARVERCYDAPSYLGVFLALCFRSGIRSKGSEVVNRNTAAPLTNMKQDDGSSEVGSNVRASFTG